jgi:hypothetical protein
MIRGAAEDVVGRLRGTDVRVATLVIGLVLMLGVFVQSLAAAAGGSLLEDKEMQDAAAYGILVSLGYLIGSATVLALPRFAMWTFVVAAAIGILAGATTVFKDLIVWGIVALILGLMAWRGSLEKRKKDAEDKAGREALQKLASQTASSEPPAG